MRWPTRRCCRCSSGSPATWALPTRGPGQGPTTSRRGDLRARLRLVRPQRRGDSAKTLPQKPPAPNGSSSWVPGRPGSPAPTSCARPGTWPDPRCSPRSIRRAHVADRGTFAEGQIAEHGGELIDQGHTQIRQLCKSLGLTLDNLLAAQQNGTEPKFWFDGAPYSYADATSDVKSIWQKIKSDVQAASYPTLYNLSTERGRQLDAMSIIDWIEESVPGGMSPRLGQLLDVAYNIEYGAECTDQSSLNLLYLLGYSGQGQLRLFGPSNEKYHVRGGNDRIVEGLVSMLPGRSCRVGPHQNRPTRRRRVRPHLATRRQVGRAERRTGWCWRCPSPCCGPSTSAAQASVTARSAPSESKAWAPTRSSTCSSSIATGAAWAANGDTYADSGHQATWEVTRAQPGTPGILVDYTGGLIGASLERALPNRERRPSPANSSHCSPASRTSSTGARRSISGPASPYQLGSYSYWKVGRYRPSPGSSGNEAAAATSPVSTPRSTSRVISTAPWRPDNERLQRSSPTTSRRRRQRSSVSARSQRRSIHHGGPAIARSGHGGGEPW